MIKRIGAFLLLFTMLSNPLIAQALHDRDTIALITQMPFEDTYEDTVKNIENAFGSHMEPLHETEGYAIHYLDQDDLTLFGYPVAITSHQNSAWDYGLIFFANDNEKLQYFQGTPASV